jgi:hypothetical protein
MTRSMSLSWLFATVSLVCASGVYAADSSSSAPAAPQPADPHALAVIAAANDRLASAEKLGAFNSYRDAFMSVTTPDFDFGTIAHLSFTRSKYLNAMQQVLAESPVVSVSEINVTSATKSTVDATIDANVQHIYDATVTDTAGYYGAKGLKHQLASTETYYEHWVPGNGPNQWKMDDMDTLTEHLIVDGKLYNPPATKAKPAPRQPTYRPRRARSGNITAF